MSGGDGGGGQFTPLVSTVHTGYENSNPQQRKLLDLTGIAPFVDFAGTGTNRLQQDWFPNMSGGDGGGAGGGPTFPSGGNLGSGDVNLFGTNRDADGNILGASSVNDALTGLGKSLLPGATLFSDPSTSGGGGTIDDLNGLGTQPGHVTMPGPGQTVPNSDGLDLSPQGLLSAPKKMAGAFTTGGFGGLTDTIAKNKLNQSNPNANAVF